MSVIPLDRPGLKEPSWDNISVGREFGPVDVVLSDHAVKSHMYALDDYHPWYLHDSPFGSRVAPSTLLTRPLLELLCLEYDAVRLRALHAREELELFGAIKVGQCVTLRGRVTDKFSKRGERYVVLAGEASDEHGTTLIRTKHTELFQSDVRELLGRRAAGSESQMLTGAMTPDAPVAKRASHDAEIGSLLPSISRRIRLEQMFVFSFGVPNIHTDQRIASESGLAGPVAQGLMSTGFLAQLFVDFFGIDWFESGWTTHAFVRPVWPGDTITVGGRIRDKRAELNATRLFLEVWCHNQAGNLTTVGSASALVSQ